MNRNFIAAAFLLAACAVPATLPGQQNPPAGAPSTPAPLPNGSRFLIRLEDELSTANHQAGRKFKARTIDPLETADGVVLAPGTEVRGHVTRIEPARITGHACMWLTFDEIDSKAGKLYPVADVVDVPGEHFLRADERHEGEIATRTSKGRREMEAAANGAIIGAAAGAAAHGSKGAAIGAAAGGAAAFLMASGIGEELVLQKGTKLELELERPLYIYKR